MRYGFAGRPAEGDSSSRFSEVGTQSITRVEREDGGQCNYRSVYHLHSTLYIIC